MKKTIEIHGQRVTLFSSDEGRTWASNPQSTIAYGEREEMLRRELKERFARIDGMKFDHHGEYGFDMPDRSTAYPRRP